MGFTGSDKSISSSYLFAQLQLLYTKIKGLIESKLKSEYMQTIDLTELDQETYYPIFGAPIPANGLHRMRVSVYLNSNSSPSWSTHDRGFMCNTEIYASPYGWGTSTTNSICVCNDYNWATVNPCGYTQYACSSAPCFYLLGGGRYYIYTDWDETWEIKTEEEVIATQTVAPTTTNPGILISNATLLTNINGTATYAYNADTLDGLHADSFFQKSPTLVLPSNGTGNVEGAEIELGNQDGTLWYIDSCENHLRIFDSNGNVHMRFQKDTNDHIYNNLIMTQSHSINVRHIEGSSDGSDGTLFLNYSNPTQNVYFGNQGYCIYNNGANYNGTAANADTVDGWHVYWDHGYYLRPIEYGTGAMTSGVSSLPTGYIYVQYE